MSTVPRPRKSSSLLINEYPLQVLPTLAVALGINEAIFLQQLHYWIDRAGSEHDDRLWVYNTMDEWLTQMPWLSHRTLERIIANLREKGFIVATAVFNESKMDRTLWYAIDYDKVESLTLTESTRESDGVEPAPVADTTRQVGGLFKGTETTTETTRENSPPPPLVDNVGITPTRARIEERSKKQIEGGFGKPRR